MDMTEKLAVGMAREESAEVDRQRTAEAVGSGTLPVFATPAMAALMEKAAANLVEEILPDEWTSVGTAISIKHSSATPPGMTVRAVAEVMEVGEKRILFEVRAFDEAGEIGRGTHERAVVERKKFLSRVNEKGKR